MGLVSDSRGDELAQLVSLLGFWKGAFGDQIVLVAFKKDEESGGGFDGIREGFPGHPTCLLR